VKPLITTGDPDGRCNRTMPYELWSKASRGILGDFPTEGKALIAFREALAANGRAYAESLAIIFEDRHGRSRAVAEGSALVELALAKRETSDPISA
jgi:hypothetical protein